MKNLPTFRQLRFLVAVVDRCHFGKAAEDCFVGQSTLSAGVQELEELLGVMLLERTKRSVTPTPVGIELAESAAIAFTLVQDDRPAQPGLRPFENKELEMFAIIVDRHAPFPIVIIEHQGIAFADPPASFLDHK